MQVALLTAILFVMGFVAHALPSKPKCASSGIMAPINKGQRHNAPLNMQSRYTLSRNAANITERDASSIALMKHADVFFHACTDAGCNSCISIDVSVAPSGVCQYPGRIYLSTIVISASVATGPPLPNNLFIENKCTWYYQVAQVDTCFVWPPNQGAGASPNFDNCVINTP